MKPLGSLSAHDARAVGCTLLAHAVVHATSEQLSSLRRNPAPTPAGPLPTGFLKHADDQTVAGLAAVLQACQALPGSDFQHWGVLAAPRFLGRVTVAHALERFVEEGAWGVSPHIIPHRSLHSISGTVSQALKIHGPNFGVGGGPDGAAKVMLAAASLLGRQSLPGLWVVLTGWNWEPGTEDRQAFLADQHRVPAVCSGVALALASEKASQAARSRFLVSPDAVDAPAGSVPAFGLEALCEALTGAEAKATRSWRLGCGGAVELKYAGEHRARHDEAA